MTALISNSVVVRHSVALSWRDAPELIGRSHPPGGRGATLKGGRGECRVPAAPIAPCAKNKAHERRRYRSAGITRHSRTRLVLTAYFELLCLGNLPECANGRFSPTARCWI